MTKGISSPMVRCSILLTVLCVPVPAGAGEATAPFPGGEVVTPTQQPVHKPLRKNLPARPVTPSEDTVVPFKGYAEARDFKVVSQKDKLTFFPCSQCHQFLPPNPSPRVLQVPAPHPSALDHGKGRIWCLNCHQVDERDHLRTLRDQKVDFDHAYIVCGQCHANRQKDWYFGGHGKRVGTWKGERILYSCTHCHDPHSPTIKPRKPSPVPPIRVGLNPMEDTVDGHDTEPVWERYLKMPQQVSHEN